MAIVPRPETTGPQESGPVTDIGDIAGNGNGRSTPDIGDLEQPYTERPIIIEVTCRYVAWVGGDYTADAVRRGGFAGELLGHDADPIDTTMRVEDPDEWDWREIYADETGPDNAPVEGPWWHCPPCLAWQAPGAVYIGRHMPTCPALAAQVATTGGAA
jgi:hypothetical protein